jgi:DNA-binding transcriptional regulator YiaG
MGIENSEEREAKKMHKEEFEQVTNACAEYLRQWESVAKIIPQALQEGQNAVDRKLVEVIKNARP